MNKNKIILYAILGSVLLAIVILCGAGCSQYNKLVVLDEKTEQSWAVVETQYQRRYDLIPNLVSTVDGYAKHESQTFETVTRARAGLEEATQAAREATAMPDDAQQMKNFAGAQERLNGAFNLYVNAVHEAYPNLKADTQFRDLQVQLEGTENRIATARTDYTNAVREYNVAVRRFPVNIIAGMFGFDKRPQFEADKAAAQAPKVEFGNN